MQVTLSGETRDKLVRAQELMRHVQPDGDLAVVLDRALSCLVQQLESRKFGKRTQREKPVAEPAAAEPTAELSPARVGRSATGAGRDAGDVEGRDGGSAAPAGARASGQLSPARVPRGESGGRGAASDGEPDLPDSKDVPRALRREVAERDGYRCTFVAADGRRCEERGRLEYHHVHARALGGKTTAQNLALRCQAHNLVDAVVDFGAEAVRGRRR